MLEEAKASFSSTCFPKLTFNPNAANLALAISLRLSEMIAKDRDGAIIRTSSPADSFFGYILWFMAYLLIGGEGVFSGQ